jgi:hypothetical protein
LLRAGHLAKATEAADELAALLGLTGSSMGGAPEQTLPDSFALRARLNAIQAKLQGLGDNRLEDMVARASRSLEEDARQLDGFAVAGEDRKFVSAHAEIRGNQVVVWSDAVASPKAVRYAWSGNPYVTLYNRQGLPAPAFRTDDWPWLSEGRKPK